MDTNEIDNIIRKYGTNVIIPDDGRKDYIKAAKLDDEVYINLKDQCLGCGASGSLLGEGLEAQNKGKGMIALDTRITEIETDPLKVQMYLDKMAELSLKDLVEGKVLHVLDYGIAGNKKNLEMQLAGQETGCKSCHIPGANTIKGLKHVLQPSVVIYHGGVGEDYEYEVRFDGYTG